MRKIREVLRLRFDHQLGQREIARSAVVSQSTIHEYLARFAASGLTWPVASELGEAELEAKLYPKRPNAVAGGNTGKSREPKEEDPDSAPSAAPNWQEVDREVHSHKYSTIRLVWEEYRQSHPDGYSYSRFCHRYQQWKRSQDLVLRQNHRPGEKMFVDWAGAMMKIQDPRTGDISQASVFVAVLGASSYTYAEATHTQQLADWIGAHTRALEFFGGATELVVPDNPKTAVTRACRYDPDLNPTYQQWALHYGVGVLPARPRKPRDKAKVESGVLVAGRWILAALRHRRFFSLTELNESIRELLARLNQRPFRKQPGSRASRFAELDQPVLRALPGSRFENEQWLRATVNIDYHVAFDHCFYSVPYGLVQKTVDVRATPATVEIFHQGQRVASHVRAGQPNTAVTDASHRPPKHRAHLEWTPERITAWVASEAGPNTARAAEVILRSYPHPEMGFRSCLGLIRLSKRYGSERMEAACERVLLLGEVRLKSVESILKKQLDRLPLPIVEKSPPQPAAAWQPHENVRGSQYFSHGNCNGSGNDSAGNDGNADNTASTEGGTR